MASVHQVKGSKKWHCAFTDSFGKRRLVSTGTADKEEAQAVCSRMRELARSLAGPKGEKTIQATNSKEYLEAGISLIQSATAGKLGETKAREYVNRVLKASALDVEIEATTTKAYFRAWLASMKLLNKSPGTLAQYKGTVENFLKALGNRAELSLPSITTTDIQKYSNGRLAAVATGTANDDLTLIQGIFRQAVDEGFLTTNPAAAVKRADVERKERAPFSRDEVESLLAVADPEWKTMILLSYYGGVRIGDAATLTWDAVDFTNKTLTFTPRKTKKTKPILVLPMNKELQRHLEGIAGDTVGPISPALAAVEVSGRGGLSRRFAALVKAAGIDSGLSEKKAEGKRRNFSSKSFHSLRHTFTTEMARGGVAKELRMKLTGHSSSRVHDTYTHDELETLRGAVDSIE